MDLRIESRQKRVSAVRSLETLIIFVIYYFLQDICTSPLAFLFILIIKSAAIYKSGVAVKRLCLWKITQATTQTQIGASSFPRSAFFLHRPTMHFYFHVLFWAVFNRYIPSVCLWLHSIDPTSAQAWLHPTLGAEYHTYFLQFTTLIKYNLFSNYR